MIILLIILGYIIGFYITFSILAWLDKFPESGINENITMATIWPFALITYIIIFPFLGVKYINKWIINKKYEKCQNQIALNKKEQ